MYNTELTFLSGKESWKDAVISFFPVFYIRIQDGKHFQEIAQFQAELAEARAQLQLLQKQLDEQLNKQPIGNQEVRASRAALRLHLPGPAEPDSAAEHTEFLIHCPLGKGC